MPMPFLGFGILSFGIYLGFGIWGFGISAPAAPAPQLTLQPLPELRPAKKPKSDKWRFTLLPVGLQINPKVDYTVFTEMTDAGRKLPEPSFANPVYYLAHTTGQTDTGDTYSGIKEIPYQKLQQILNTSLASNGYRPADAAHPPTQVLFFSWGRHNKIELAVNAELMSENDILKALTEPPDPGARRVLEKVVAREDIRNTLENIIARAKIIGGKKFAIEVTHALVARSITPARLIDDAIHVLKSGDIDAFDPDAPEQARADDLEQTRADDLIQALTDAVTESFASEVDQSFANHHFDNFSTDTDLTNTLCYAVENDCYYLLVMSMDAEALSRYKQREVLWITRITTVSQGLNFEQTLPIMINNASYYFGRETAVPEIILKRAYKNASVEIGEAQVVDYITGASGTTTGATKPAATGTTSPPAPPAAGSNK